MIFIKKPSNDAFTNILSLTTSKASHFFTKLLPTKTIRIKMNKRKRKIDDPDPQKPRKATKVVPTQECAICCDVKNSTRFQFPEIEGCTHEAQVCLDCCLRYLKEKLQGQGGWNGTLVVGCLTCNKSPTQDQWTAALPRKTVKNLINEEKEANKTRRLQADRNHRFCPYPDCSHGQIYPPPAGFDKKVACAKCKRFMCFQHKCVWHEGIPCVLYNDSPEADLQRTTEQLIDQTTKKCPHCQTRTQKIGGCDIITCPVCKRCWNWLDVLFSGETVQSTADFRGGPEMNNLPRVRAMGDAALRYHQAQEDERQRNIRFKEHMEEMDRRLLIRYNELRQRDPDRYPAPVPRPLLGAARRQLRPAVYHIGGIGRVEVPQVGGVYVPPHLPANNPRVLNQNQPHHQPAGNGEGIHPELLRDGGAPIRDNNNDRIIHFGEVAGPVFGDLRDRDAPLRDDNNDRIIRLGEVAGPQFGEFHFRRAADEAQRAQVIDLTHD